MDERYRIELSEAKNSETTSMLEKKYFVDANFNAFLNPQAFGNSTIASLPHI